MSFFSNTHAPGESVAVCLALVEKMRDRLARDNAHAPPRDITRPVRPIKKGKKYAFGSGVKTRSRQRGKSELTEHAMECVKAYLASGGVEGQTYWANKAGVSRSTLRSYAIKYAQAEARREASQ